MESTALEIRSRLFQLVTTCSHNFVLFDNFCLASPYVPSGVVFCY